MLNKTSLSAIRTLLFLLEQEPGVVLPPRRIAEELSESPTYLAKITRLLVRAGILRAEKGVKGGVQLLRPAADVTLLSVVEACQGTVAGDYCEPATDPDTVCSFHQAATELHEVIVSVLARWNLERLAEKPRVPAKGVGGFPCVMAGNCGSGLVPSHSLIAVEFPGSRRIRRPRVARG